MRMFSLASGSKGNCIYVESSDTKLLIDVGISLKKIQKILQEREIFFEDIDAIIITHEHIDHIKALKIITKKYNIPIFLSKGTFLAIKDINFCDTKDANFSIVKADKDFYIRDIKVRAFNIKHDAREPFAYRFSKKNQALAIVTDLGCYDEYIINNLKDLDAIFLESNHEIRILEAGAYPFHLKKRILGDFGHLSNCNASKLLSLILSDKLKKIFLGHLSAENNNKFIALMCVKNTIADIKKYELDKLDIEVATYEKPSSILDLGSENENYFGK